MVKAGPLSLPFISYLLARISSPPAVCCSQVTMKSPEEKVSTSGAYSVTPGEAEGENSAFTTVPSS